MKQSIAIVGGGIIGLTIAATLRQRPGTEVTVLERDIAGQGASARSAGLHFPIGSTALVRQMTAESQAYYESEIAKSPEGPICQVPMRAHMQTGGDHAIFERFLPQAQLQPLAHPGPRVSPHGIDTWFVSGAHWCDVPLRVRMLKNRLQGHATLREGCRVKALNDTPRGAEVTLSDDTVHRFDRVILAPGPWSAAPEFARFVKPLGISTKRIVAFHIDAPASLDDAAEVFLNEDAFLLPLPCQGRWLFSYTCQEWDVSPDAPGYGITQAHRAAAADVLGRYVPQWVEKLSGGRIFCDAYSPDYTPVIRPVSAHDNIIFAGAANGAGYRLAPAIARRAADFAFAQILETTS